MKLLEAINGEETLLQRRMNVALRWVTVLAGMVILAGGVLWLRGAARAPVAFHSFSGEPASLRSVPQILVGASQCHPLAIVQLGILLLVSIPVLRVLCVGIGYVIERDWLYVTVAGIVLAVLAASLSGHKL
jgi:uncharacterized membrane protein